MHSDDTLKPGILVNKKAVRQKKKPKKQIKNIVYKIEFFLIFGHVKNIKVNLHATLDHLCNLSKNSFTHHPGI